MTSTSSQSGGLSVRTSAFTTGPDYVQALLEGMSWSGTFGRTSTVNYTFDASTEGGTKNTLETQRAAQMGMQEWSNVANIRFVQSTSSSPLRFSTADLPSDDEGETVGLATILNSGTTLTSVEVQIDTSYAPALMDRGEAGYFTMLHEIGHAIGIKHPFDEEGGDGSTLDSEFDTYDYTVMSYTEGELITEARPAVTPLLFDIAAAQYLYGANTSYHAGNDQYVIAGTETIGYAIWDAGGNDSIVAGLAGSAALIDLTDTYDFENEFRSEDITPGLNKIGETVFYVAFNSNIEYAKGNSGNDTINGSNDNNTLLGAGGNDTIDGWTGNDTIYGGQAIADPNDGNDLIRGDLGTDLIYGNTGNDYIFGGGGLYSEGAYDLADTVRSGTKTIDASQLSGAGAENIYHDDEDGADTIYGGYGTDVIFGNGGADKLYGGGAASDPNDQGDTIIGGHGQDTILGNGGNDLILGGHTLYDTTDSADVIYGGFGNDTIYGNGGDDVIWTNQGNDQMHGGGGIDLYIFYHDSGIDSILQFETPGNGSGDYIYIYENVNNTGIDSADDMLSRITYRDAYAEINLGGANKILVYGLGTSQLTVGDFFVFGLPTG